MMFPGTIMLRVIDWIATHLGLDPGIRGCDVFDSLDEREVTEQLHHGRD